MELAVGEFLPEKGRLGGCIQLAMDWTTGQLVDDRVFCLQLRIMGRIRDSHISRFRSP
jgi:hypothetical protein